MPPPRAGLARKKCPLMCPWGEFTGQADRKTGGLSQEIQGMGETGWKDEQTFSKQQESLWMEGTTRAEPGGQRCVQAGVDSREHGGMVRGPYGRRVAQEVAGAGGRAEGPGFWFCRLWGVGACSDGCELGGHYGSRAVHCTRCRDRLTGYCNSPDEEGWCLCEMAGGGAQV